jgi:hypothetical protein
MTRTPSTTHYVAVSDFSKPLAEQEGILIQVEGRGGDNHRNRTKALEIVQQMWQKGDIEADKFPDGLTQDNILYVPPDSPNLQSPRRLKKSPQVPPIVQGAQEIIELTKLQLEVQEAAEEAEPYLPIIHAILERTRPLTAEEKELVKDKKYAKTLEKLGTIIAEQENYRETGTKYASLILNAIAWQLNKGVKELIPAKKTAQKRKPPTTTRRKTSNKTSRQS